MKKWKVKAKQGSRVVTATVATPEKKSAEEYTKYTLGEISTQPVEILETTEKKKKKKP
jgi:hypothetical protein